MVRPSGRVTASPRTSRARSGPGGTPRASAFSTRKGRRAFSWKMKPTLPGPRWVTGKVLIEKSSSSKNTPGFRSTVDRDGRLLAVQHNAVDQPLHAIQGRFSPIDFEF